MRQLTQSEFEVAFQAMKDAFSAIWCKNVPGESKQQAGENNKDYRKRFRGAFHMWATAMYADEVVLTNLLRQGFSGADTPAKLLGTAIHAHNDHTKQNRKDKNDNRKTELQEYSARKVRRALRFGATRSSRGTIHTWRGNARAFR